MGKLPGGGHPSAPHASGPALPRGLRGALGAPSRPRGAPKGALRGALRGQGDAERPAPRPRRPPSPARPRPGLTRCGPAASRLSPMASPCGRQPGPPPGRSRARTPPRLASARHGPAEAPPAAGGLVWGRWEAREGLAARPAGPWCSEREVAQAL